jgi:putative ABC transport system substrate-binding protein
MRRREILGLIGSATAWPFAARAQQPATKKRLAIVVLGKVEDARIGRDPAPTIFFEELQRLGYVEGENLIVDRWQLQMGRREEIAREVVDTKPDVIACSGWPMTLSLKAATTTIPIVANTGDPIPFGIVSNLARPGGNVTGVSVDAGVEIWAKRLELLSNAVPKLVNVVFVSSEGIWMSAGGQVVRDAAQKLGISLVRGTVSSPYGEAEYRSAFSSLQRDQLDGLILSDEGTLHLPQKSLLVQLIQQKGIPAIYPYAQFAEAGGLMSYSSDLKSVIHRMVAQIVEIFRGANPGEIPYSQAVRFALVVNLKTAKALGLTMPPTLLARADEVIE